MSNFELFYRFITSFLFTIGGLGLWLAGEPLLGGLMWLLATIQVAMIWISVE